MKPSSSKKSQITTEEEPSPLKSRAKKSKKRNREEKEEQEPKIHQTTEPEEKNEGLQVKIQVLEEHPNKIPPLVAYFPTGYDPFGAQQQEDDDVEEDSENDGLAYQTEPPSVKVFRNKAQRKRIQVVVSPSQSKVDFVGSSYSGEAAAPQVCRYSLGVLDKETGTLKIVPIASNKIIRLEPRIRGLEAAKDAPSPEKGESTNDRNDKMGELTALYGTKKDRKKRKDYLALKKEVDSESQKTLDKKIESITFDKAALGSTSAFTARNIPPYDSSAATPVEAYPLDKIILTGDWDYLVDIYNTLHAGEEVASDGYPKFVSNRIHKLEAIKDESERMKLSCIFSYITHLLKFKDQFAMGHSAAAKNHKIPNIIRQRFCSMFTDPGSKILSADSINFLISYVLVLTLHADDFQTSPSDIAKDLRMSEVGLRPHFLNLGCKLKNEKNTLYATLPVPLMFPSEKNLKAKRRK